MESLPDFRWFAAGRGGWFKTLIMYDSRAKVEPETGRTVFASPPPALGDMLNNRRTR
jgi:hypothetical protein